MLWRACYAKIEMGLGEGMKQEIGEEPLHYCSESPTKSIKRVNWLQSFSYSCMMKSSNLFEIGKKTKSKELYPLLLVSEHEIEFNIVQQTRSSVYEEMPGENDSILLSGLHSCGFFPWSWHFTCRACDLVDRLMRWVD